MTKRLYKFDNIKTILIVLVVFGHLLELVKACDLIYLIIYSFHMPLFMFVTGYFARFDKKQIFYRMICPYILFQILYTYFEIYILGMQELTLTFVKPRWLLWYLFAIIVYYLLIPFFDIQSEKGRVYMILMSVIIALLSGYDTKLGYDFSAARILNFMPFFLAGFYMKREQNPYSQRIAKTDMNYPVRIAGAIVAIAAIAVIVLMLNQGIITKKMLYGSYSYDAIGYNIWVRLLIFAIASVWIALFLMLVPNKRIPIVSETGRYTMPIFLFHGFAVKLIGKYCNETGAELTVYTAFMISLVLVLVLGNKYLNKLFVPNHKLQSDKLHAI